MADFYAYARVDGVGQMAGWLPHENMEKSREILNHFIEGKKTFALEYQGKVIGSLGVEEYREALYPELAALQGRSIGYVLSKDYWGQGLMPEAVEAVAMFEAMYAEYQLNPDITRSRMYYEAIAQILPGIKVYINTGDSSSLDMLLPLESIVGGN